MQSFAIQASNAIVFFVVVAQMTFFPLKMRLPIPMNTMEKKKELAKESNRRWKSPDRTRPCIGNDGIDTDLDKIIFLDCAERATRTSGEWTAAEQTLSEK